MLEISDIIHTAEYQTAQRNTYRSNDTFPFLLFKKPGKAFNLGKINGWSSDYHHPFIPSVTRAVCVCARQLAQSTSNLGPSVKRRWGPSLRETNDLSHVIDHLPMGHLSFLCLARCNPLVSLPRLQWHDDGRQQGNVDKLWKSEFISKLWGLIIGKISWMHGVIR